MGKDYESRGIRDYGDRGIKNYVSSGVSIGLSPLRFLLKIVSLTIGLLFAFLFLSTIYFGVTTGELPERLLIALETINLDKPVLSGIEFIYNIATAQYVKEDQIGYVGTTRKVEEKVGISIKDFKSRDNNVRLNEPILATAQIEISKAPEDQNILLKFEDACYLEDYTEQARETRVIPETELISAGMNNFIFSARCEFPQGFSELESYGPNELVNKTETTDVKKTSDLKVLRLNPKFTYEQVIVWLPYTKERYVSGEKTRTPSWDLSVGPASLRIGSSDSQPFYMNDQHDLYVYLESNWPGDIKEINNLELNIPDNIELLTDSKYCDFKRTGNSYQLSSMILQKTKIDCNSKDALEGLKSIWPGRTTDVTVEECINKYKKKFEFSCPFILNDAERVESQTPIKVRASYIYEMRAINSITLLDSENMNVA